MNKCDVLGSKKYINKHISVHICTYIYMHTHTMRRGEELPHSFSFSFFFILIFASLRINNLWRNIESCGDFDYIDSVKLREIPSEEESRNGSEQRMNIVCIQLYKESWTGQDSFIQCQATFKEKHLDQICFRAMHFKLYQRMTFRVC